MARRGQTKPIVSQGVQIVAGLGASVCSPGENPGPLGELVHVRNTIAGDWVGTRYYAVDYDLGSDEAVGFSDVSMAAAGAVALKTIEELITRLPKLGQGQRGVVAIKTRAGGATYLKKDGITPDKIALDGLYGYFHLLVRGTGDVPTAGAVAFANDTADKIALGAQMVAGTNAAGYNAVQTAPGGQTGAAASIIAGAAAGNMRVSGLTGMTAASVGRFLVITGAATGANNGSFPIVAFVSATTVDVQNTAAVIPDANNGAISWTETSVTAFQFDVQLAGGGAPGLAAEPSLIGKRIRFDSATVTVALRNATAGIHANDTDTITVMDNLPAIPVPGAGGDVFYIEEPGLAVDMLSITSTTPNVQAVAPSFATQGIHVAGLRTTSTAAGAGGFIFGPNACILSFIESASTSFSAFSVNNFLDFRVQRTYTDEAGATIITGVGVRAPGGLNVNRGTRLLVASTALVGPGAIGRTQVTDVVTNTIGAGSYMFIGVLIQVGGNGASAVGGVFSNLIGRGNSTTARRLRVLAPTGSPSCGINVSFGDATVYGVDITGMGTSACLILRGVGGAWSINDVVGSTGNSGRALDLQVAKDAHIVMGTLAVNTFTGGVGQDIVGASGGERYVHADYARTDLRDSSGNHIQGTAGCIVGTTVQATNNAVADIGQYNIVFAPPASGGTVQAASAAAAATAAALGVTQSPMMAGVGNTQIAMVVNGGGTWVQFDAAGAPTINAIAYLSTLTPGNAQVGIPAVAGTNQKLRLGRILRVSGTLGYVGWHPESLAVLADGAA